MQCLIYESGRHNTTRRGQFFHCWTAVTVFSMWKKVFLLCAFKECTLLERCLSWSSYTQKLSHPQGHCGYRSHKHTINYVSGRSLFMINPSSTHIWYSCNWIAQSCIMPQISERIYSWQKSQQIEAFNGGNRVSVFSRWKRFDISQLCHLLLFPALS